MTRDGSNSMIGNGKGSLDQLLKLASLAESKGNYEQSVTLYKRAVALDSHNKQAYNAIGRNCRRLGRIDEAIDHYLRAVDIDPRYSSAHLDRAWASPLSRVPRKNGNRVGSEQAAVHSNGPRNP